MPSLTGSPPMMKTIGIVDVAAFAACVGGTPPTATITADLLAREFGGQSRQPVDVVLSPAVLYRHISMFEKTGLV